MPKRVFDTKMFYGPMEKLDSKNGSANTNNMVNAITPEEKMHAFLATEEVAKKESFRIDKMTQSQAFDVPKMQMMVTITILFSWDGTEDERPSQKFNKEKLADRKTEKFPTRPPAVRQPDNPALQISSVPQVKSA